MSENNKKESKFSKLTGLHKAVPIILAALAIFISICLFAGSGGLLGSAVGGLIRGLFSHGAYAIPLLMLWHAICYADDLEEKKILKRAIFSSLIVLTVSCTDYAIYSWGGAVFSPVANYVNMVGGGFIGGTIGFAITKLIGSIGTIILFATATAIVTVFFYADKAGSLGQAAKNLSENVKKANEVIKEKKKENDERKKQLEEEQAQLQREAASEELINDDFFTAKGPSSNVKVKKLGIDEEVSPHGTSPLIHPSKRPVFEEPEEIVVAEPVEKRRRRADKPLDLSYGMDEEKLNPITKTEEFKAEESVPVAEETVEEPKKNEYSKSFFGLDDSADNVFTKDFDPFDFATNEKVSAKFANRVSVSAVKEELDEFALYEMKANHVPTAREKRLAEFEARKQEWLNKKQASAPAAEAKEEPTTPVKEEPAIPLAINTESQPSVTEVKSDPVAERKPEPEKINAYSTYSNTRTTYTQPIKTVEFTISKGPKIEQDQPIEGQTVSMKINKQVHQEEATEDVAKLIAEKIARETPGYLRSANDLKTFTKVTSSPEEDELLLRLQGAFNNDNVAESDDYEPTATPTVTDTISPTVADSHNEEAHATPVFTPTTPAISPDESSVEFSFGDPEKTIVEETPHTISNDVQETTPVIDLSPVQENPAQAAYQRAAGFASALVNQPQPTVNFKPYNPTPTPAVSQPAISTEREATIKVEREMLTPTPVAEAPIVTTQPTSAVETKAQEIPMAVPASEPAPMAIPLAIPTAAPIANKAPITNTAKPSEDIGIPLFSVVEDDAEKKGSSVEANDFQWTRDDVATKPEVASNEGNFDEILDFSEDNEMEEDILPSDQIPEEETEEMKEIPPEEQNPDVVKMRRIFPFLFPETTVTPTQPPQSSAEAVEPEVSTPAAVVTPQPTVAEKEIDDVPFDNPVVKKEVTFEPIVKSSSPSTSLVPANEKKPEKKKADYSNYQFPSLELLAKEESTTDDNIQAEIQENADKLIETLASFNVTASIKGVDRGPRITRYEVVPAKGVKVSQIMNLQDDIALNLAAGSIRMEAPIPGKSAVGIEIPNKKSSIVRLRDLLETTDFQTARSKTFVCIGRDVAGQPVFGDISKMPHLLIAGATGMGKSVCINSLLISVLYKARPDEVKFIMIDPKQVEFTMYNGIPHLLVPVVSDAKQAAGALMWAVEEMERRYNLLNPLCVRNIEAYNEKVTADPSLGDPMPKIVIVIDEFADLMLQVKDPVENLVMRIAQKARAAGIYLVIGTQRPSVNVITGVIKANVPSRISCKVMSNVDSKTVLDSAGAEKLLDRGDALYAPAGSPKPHRVQCAFVADGEVESIMNYLKQFSDGSNYDSNVMEEIERAAQKCSKKGGGNNDYDEGDNDSDSNGEGYLNNRQFLDAVEVAVNTRKISTSLIQRKLSIGYGKAAKFIDVMEDMGIVGEANGQRPREVLLTPDEWREKLARASLD